MNSAKNLYPSNRNFGLFFCCFFAFLSANGAYHGAEAFKVYTWATAGVVVGFIAVLSPGLLAPFNKAWMKLGDLLGKVVSPLILGVFFFILITPVALIMRLVGRDELRLKRSSTQTYWISRTPPGPDGDSFKNQF